MEAILKDISKWRDILFLYIEILNILKITILPKMIYWYNAIYIKILGRDFIDIGSYIKINMKNKRNYNSWNNFEKELQNGMKSVYLISTLTANQHCVVLAEGWTHRSMVTNRQPRNKSTQVSLSDFWRRCKWNLIEERYLFQNMVLEQLDIYRVKEPPIKSTSYKEITQNDHEIKIENMKSYNLKKIRENSLSSRIVTCHQKHDP